MKAAAIEWEGTPLKIATDIDGAVPAAGVNDRHQRGSCRAALRLRSCVM
jgi:hypothetical protein